MYITTYAADAWALLDTRRLWQHYHNSYLMSECKHHLMDSAVMRNGPHTPTCWKTTSLASRLNVTVKVVKTCSFFKKKIHTTFIWLSWWDDHNMASDMFKNTRWCVLPQCFPAIIMHHIEICFIQNDSMWGRILAVGLLYAKSASIPENKSNDTLIHTG